MSKSFHYLLIMWCWSAKQSVSRSDCLAWSPQSMKTLKHFRHNHSQWPVCWAVQRHPVCIFDLWRYNHSVHRLSLSPFLLSSQDSSSDGQGEDRGLSCVHAGHAWRTTSAPGKGQGLHLRLCVRHRLRAAAHLWGLRVQAHRGLLRGLQRHRVRLWSGMTQRLGIWMLGVALRLCGCILLWSFLI